MFIVVPFCRVVGHPSGSISTVGMKAPRAHPAVGQSRADRVLIPWYRRLYGGRFAFTRARARFEVVLSGGLLLDLEAGPLAAHDRLTETSGAHARSTDMDALITLLAIIAGLALLDPIGRAGIPADD